LLDQRLTRARTFLPDVVAISGSTDPYQPAEERFQNTKQCLEVLAKHKYPVHIGTKSTLVVRDSEILNRIAQDTWCAVSITITTLDPKLAAFFEPRSPPPKERLETIKKLKASGKMHVGINLMPIIPFLTDSKDNLEEVVINASQAGADYILFGAGMTMRDNQAVWFLKQLKKSYPELVKNYLELYNATWNNGNIYQGNYSPEKSYMKKISKSILWLCEKYRIPYRMKRFIPSDFRRLNYMISEEFLNEAYDNQLKGRPWSNLYWAGQNIQNLNEPINSLADKKQLQSIRNVTPELEERISKLIEKVPNPDTNKFF
jgi:DNA repair photolyase